MLIDGKHTSIREEVEDSIGALSSDRIAPARMSTIEIANNKDIVASVQATNNVP